MQSRSIQFARYTLNTLIVQLFVFAILVAVTIITARALGPSGRGQYMILTQTATIAFVIAELGLGQAIVYYIGTRKLSLRQAASSALFLHLMIGVAASGLVLLVAFFFRQTVYAGTPFHYVVLMAALVPLVLIASSQQSVVQGHYKIPMYNILGMLQPATVLLLLVLLTLVAGWGLEGAVIAWAVGAAVAFVGTIVAVSREGGLGISGVSRGAVTDLLSFGIKSYAGNFLKYLQYRFDIFIVAYFVSAAAVGYYSVAHAVGEVVWQIPGAIQTVLFPRIASFNKAEAKGFTPVVCRQSILITAAVCIALFAIANFFIPFVFGEAYIPAIIPLAILLPGVFMLGIWKVLHADVVAQGYPHLYSITSAVSAVTMIAMDIILIPIWGINGAALACTIAYTASTILIIYFYLRVSDNSLRSILVPEPSDFSLYKSLLKNLLASLPTRLNRS